MGFLFQVDTVQCNILGCDSEKNEKYTRNFCCEIWESRGISMRVLEHSTATNIHDVGCENVDWFHVDMDKIQWRSSDVVRFHQTQTRLPCSILRSGKFAPVHAVKAWRGSKDTAPRILPMFRLCVKLECQICLKNFQLLAERWNLNKQNIQGNRAMNNKNTVYEQLKWSIIIKYNTYSHIPPCSYMTNFAFCSQNLGLILDFICFSK